MHAHNGRDDHLDGRIMSGSKCVHDPLPYSGPSPPDETVVAGGAWTVTIRQIAPWCAGSQHPADTVEGTSIVHTRHASRLVRQHRPDGRPFIIREFVAHDSRLQFGSLKSCAGRPSIGKGPSIQRLLSEHSGHCWTCPRPPQSRLTQSDMNQWRQFREVAPFRDCDRECVPGYSGFMLATDGNLGVVEHR